MHSGNFYLEKWFLDFVGVGGEAMIFYAAKLSWYGLTVPYTCWFNYDPVANGTTRKSRFRNIQLPEKTESLISWSDPKLSITGKWEARAEAIQARLFASEAGYLDWNCFQPASQVELNIRGNILQGSGYAEQLILTALPWNIPMHELRWGRYGSVADHMVWIEIKEKDRRQWLWLNGAQMENCLIEDDQVSIPEKGISLKLDQGAVLESEKTIFSVVENLLHYFPGFKNGMPMNFLLADNYKWLSKAQLLEDSKPISTGTAIHELVNFKSHPS